MLGKGQGQGAILWVLIGLIILAFGFWIYGRYSSPIKKPTTRWIGRGAAAAAVLCFFTVIGSKAVNAKGDGAAVAASSKTVHGLEYEPFDPVKALEYVKAGKDVFIDYTAVW